MTITVTNIINGRSDSVSLPTEADAAAFILWLNSEFDATTFTVEVDA